VVFCEKVYRKGGRNAERGTRAGSGLRKKRGAHDHFGDVISKDTGKEKNPAMEKDKGYIEKSQSGKKRTLKSLGRRKSIHVKKKRGDAAKKSGEERRKNVGIDRDPVLNA